MRRAEVSLRTKEAIVVFDPSQATVEQMIDEVRHLGFRVKPKHPPPATFFLHADSFPPAAAVEPIERALRDERGVGGAFEHRFEEPRWSLRAISWGGNTVAGSGVQAMMANGEALLRPEEVC
ncbi:MAG: hypothetical protein HY294_15125 [Candidatus Rokubacteria bacterium]|nr:hypothetical protein [Candidatus Rokubacteria bacterium]